VTVGEQPPVESRYYDGVDPMGLFWSMRPVGTDPTESLPPGALFRPPAEAFEVTLTAETGGRTLAEATTTRRMYEQDIERVEPPDDLVGAAFMPPGDDPVPGVIHLHGLGGQPFVGLARLLASRGFAALALQYFGDPEPLPDTLLEVPVEYVERAIDWLDAHERVSGGSVGLFGFSRGGPLALLTASRNDYLGAVVGWVPSGVVYEGLGPDRAPAGTAAWSIDGEPVPYLELAEADPGPPPTSGLPFFEPPLDDESRERLEAAEIPVEDADAPIYLASVTDDQRWPSTRLCERVVDRLDGTGYPHSYRHDAFEGAGHFMIPPYLPTAGTTRDSTDIYGGSPAANARADEIAWNRTLSFLSRSLHG
jgi:nucleolar protein 56